MNVQRTTTSGARIRCVPSANHHGAAFLLAVYVASLTLLLLGGVSLQRTMTEVRAADLSRDLHQAFWMAEAGFDRAITTLRASSAATGRGEGQSSTGRYSYEMKTAVDFKQQAGKPAGYGAIELIKHITATGTTLNGRTAAVTATVLTPQTTGGVMANGRIIVEPDVQPSTIKGDLRSARGRVYTVKLRRRAFIDGDVVIGPPIGIAEGGYLNLYGPNQATDGVYLKNGADPAERVSGQIRAEPMDKSLPAIRPATCQDTPKPFPDPDRSGKIVHIRDGGRWDLSHSGDGVVVMCVSYVDIHAGTKVIVHDPTVLYAVDVGPRTHSFYGSRTTDPYAFYNDGKINVVDSLKRTADHGLTVVVTAPPGRSTAGDLFLGKFEGSVYAPASKAEVELAPSEEDRRDPRSPMERQLGFIVVDGILVRGVDVNFRRQPSSGKAEQDVLPNVSVLSWTN